MKSLPPNSIVPAAVLACVTVCAISGYASAAPPAAQESTGVDSQSEKKYSIKFETTEHKRYCRARVRIDYSQRNTVANVTGTIDNDDCSASGGKYTVSVRVRDDDGEVQDIEHEELWQRDDDRTIEIGKDYYIGENVDLVRVRPRKVECICADMPAESGSEATKGENE